MSQKTELLFAVVLGLSSLIRPLTWRHPTVPVVLLRSAWCLQTSEPYILGEDPRSCEVDTLDCRWVAKRS